MFCNCLRTTSKTALRIAPMLPLREYSSRFNFDTYKLVRQLERQGFSRGQSVAIMRTINALLVDSTLSVRGQMLSKTEVDNEAYLYKTNLEELKNEIQVMRQNETSTMKADVDQIMRSMENLNQKLAERVAALKADISMDINHHKTEARDIGTTTDLKIQEIHHKLVIKVSDLKTKMETIKMDLTRNIGPLYLHSPLYYPLNLYSLLPLKPPAVARRSPHPSERLHTSVDDASSQEALKTLSEFYPVNSATARRNLRKDVDQRVSHLNSTFLEAYDDVTKNLSALQNAVMLLNECCSEMERKLAVASTQTSELMKHTSEMKLKGQKVQTRKIIADAFIARFTLTDSDIMLLTSSATPVNREFFAALKRAMDISDDCKALLITEHQQAGLEIMEKTSQFLEVAYDRLFRWAQAECRSMSGEIPEVSSGMKDAISALRQRPVLFQTCVDEISQMRQAAIARAFLEALTQGGPNGLPRPIEIHAHDPLRYIGDMLGWLHQACVSERDLIEGILTGGKGESEKKRSEQKLQNDETLFSILEKNMERTCRPFQVRIEQVLGSQPGAITAYRIANTLQFYLHTISQVIGKNGRLQDTLREVTETAYNGFLDTLRQYGEKIQNSGEVPGRDLLPPPIIKESLLQLKELMSSYEGNLLELDESSSNFNDVLKIILDPVVDLCKQGAASLPVLEGCIYKLNCFRFLQATLIPYSTFTKQRLDIVEADINDLVVTLTKEAHNLLLQESGLLNVIKALEKNKEEAPLSRIPGLDQRSIKEAMSKLDTFLRDIGFDVTARFARLASSHDTKVIIDTSLKDFSDNYTMLHERVMDPKNKYEFPVTLMTRSVDELDTLLSFK
ncbi:Golgi transport complex subunit 6 [Phlyctochytrium planicorne]|nr:Golgi transport complex subunit 6 [Phlyctochytrium planicorne]